MSAAYSPLTRRLFNFYLNYRFSRAFDQVTIQNLACTTGAADSLDLTLPIVLVANHGSWWDGFFLAKLQNQLAPRSQLLTVMLESELRKYPYFRKMGAVGIDPKNPVSVARVFLNLRQKVQSSPLASVIAYFPQGQICPQFDFPLNFRSGIELLLRILPPSQVIPVALTIEPLSKAKPSAFIFYGRALLTGQRAALTAPVLEGEVEKLLLTHRPPIIRQRLARFVP